LGWGQKEAVESGGQFFVLFPTLFFFWGGRGFVLVVGFVSSRETEREK
jgi:hypothetical protein